MGSLLEQHGTKLATLKPGSVVAAAVRDLIRRRRKRAGQAERWDHYCFHRHHVRSAKDAADLISRALDDRRRGEASGKRMTRLVYGDQDLLCAALLAAKEWMTSEAIRNINKTRVLTPGSDAEEITPANQGGTDELVTHP